MVDAIALSAPDERGSDVLGREGFGHRGRVFLFQENPFSAAFSGCAGCDYQWYFNVNLALNGSP